MDVPRIVTGASAFSASVIVWAPRRLDAVDGERRALRLQGCGTPGDESAAADRHEHMREVGKVVEEFETDGAVAGDDGRIVIGMTRTAFRLAIGLGLAKASAASSQSSTRAAVLFRKIDIEPGCDLRHQHECVDAQGPATFASAIAWFPPIRLPSRAHALPP